MSLQVNATVVNSLLSLYYRHTCWSWCIKSRQKTVEKQLGFQRSHYLLHQLCNGDDTLVAGIVFHVL